MKHSLASIRTSRTETSIIAMQARTPGQWLRELRQRQATLTAFGLLLWALMIPALIAMGIDERTFRGVSVWAKPLKFMASLGLFSLYSAWFIGLLPPEWRQGRTVRAIVWTIVSTSAFELAYITWQASLGQASHYNINDSLHIVMYGLMGFGAFCLTATQMVLSVLVHRHGRREMSPVLRQSIVLGLAMTFLLGAGAGAFLSGLQAPAGAGLPVLGWHLEGGDLRPAHFLGIHAQQFLPFAGLLLSAWPQRKAMHWLYAITLGLFTLWGMAMARGLGLF